MLTLEKLLDIFTPHNCIICGQESRLICNWCLPDAFEGVPERCFICFAVSKGATTCPKCRKLTGVNRAWVISVYNGSAKQLILGMKLKSNRQAASIIGHVLHEGSPYYDNRTVVTYVPTSPLRVRQRGFDHTKRIAEEFSRLRDLPCKPLLARTGHIKQVGAKRSDRLKQVRGIYRANSKLPKATQIVLIDDVVTTGATLSECTRVLKKAGARQVDALVFAQTI